MSKTQAKRISHDLDASPTLFDYEAEAGVVGSILLTPNVIDDVTCRLKPDDFHDPDHGIFLRHMLALQSASQRIDVTTLLASLKTAGDYTDATASQLARITQSVPNASNAAYYADIVRDRSIRRALCAAGYQIVRNAVEAGDTREALAAAETAVLAIGERNAKSDHTHQALDLMRAAVDRLQARKEGKATDAIPTGYTPLDKILGGGLRRGELFIIAGRPSMGKSALVMNILEDLAIRRSLPVLLVSLEMSSASIADRILASQSRIDLKRIAEGTFSRDEGRALQDMAARISQAPLIVDDAPCRTLAEIGAIARRVNRKRKLAALAIDYLQLIEPDNPKDTRQEQVAKLSRRVKSLARELQTPVICLSQLNRATEEGDKRPRLSNLRESGAIEQDADVVAFVHRPGYYELRQGPAPVGENAEIIVAKQRNGPTETTNLNWFGRIVRFDVPTQQARQCVDFGPEYVRDVDLTGYEPLP
jgi:replicative DNA helicase